MSGTGPSRSMRENYNTFGVDNYYNLVSSSYRNPHFIPVKHCIYDWMNTWWAREGFEMELDVNEGRRIVRVFDLACGRSACARPVERHETNNTRIIPNLVVTEALTSWLETARRNRILGSNAVPVLGHPARRKVHWQQSPPSLSLEELSIRLCAADPYTAAAYHDRVKFTCAELFFQDVANGALPTTLSELCTTESADTDAAAQPTQVPVEITKDTLEPVNHYDGTGDAAPSAPLVLDMVFCSFALHLIETPSQLFSLLWELSQKARWLIVIAPHKKPEIKDGWGWVQWNIGQWRLSEREPDVEILQDRVHLRLFKSAHFS